MKKSVKILKDEYWWGGVTCVDGDTFPLDENSVYSFDLVKESSNQTMPLYLSSKGRYIWTESEFVTNVSGGEITIESESEIELSEGHGDLKGAYLAACEKHFKFTGKYPPLKFFTTAQYNTWMEYDYRLDQNGVLDYARKIVDNGYAPGVLILDEGWHNHYGLWEFDKVKYPDPKAMIDELHELGFKVMLWVVPYVTADGYEFITDRDKTGDEECFLRLDDGNVALARWWNGYSAVLNMCKSGDRAYLDEKLKRLMDDYGVDGFKFDGGNISIYGPDWIVNGKQTEYTPAQLNIAWNEFGEKYEYHEYKDSFKRGGRPVIQRIRDRGHRWVDDGINTLVPTGIMQGLTGYPFICPDMIGGGEWTFNYMKDFSVDEELFIRMAECSALFPMMQFSWAPWRVLNEENQKICLNVAKLHAEFSDYIVEQVKYSAVSGEPIIRCMEYEFPHCGYEKLTGQYMFGDKVLVAPVVTKGARTQKVELPEGEWLYLGKTLYKGGCTVEVPAPLEVLPYFIKK